MPLPRWESVRIQNRVHAAGDLSSSCPQALEACDDQGLVAEISQHSLRQGLDMHTASLERCVVGWMNIKGLPAGLDTLERLQKDKQKKQFAGFWDKFQELHVAWGVKMLGQQLCICMEDRGGYSEGKPETQELQFLPALAVVVKTRMAHAIGSARIGTNSSTGSASSMRATFSPGVVVVGPCMFQPKVEDYEERYMYVDQDQQQEDSVAQAKKHDVRREKASGSQEGLCSRAATPPATRSKVGLSRQGGSW